MAFPGVGITADQAPRIARRSVSKFAASEMDNLLLADSSLDGRICCDASEGSTTSNKRGRRGRAC